MQITGSRTGEVTRLKLRQLVVLKGVYLGGHSIQRQLDSGGAPVVVVGLLIKGTTNIHIKQFYKSRSLDMKISYTSYGYYTHYIIPHYLLLLSFG